MLQSNSPIKRENTNELGRLGGFFQFDQEPGVIYGISNNHVIANRNQCKQGDIICDMKNQPVGALSDWIRLNINSANDTEFALFKINPGTPPVWNLWDQYSGKKPFGFKSPVVNMNVVYPVNGKLKNGIIQSINTRTQINWMGDEYQFTNCIKIVAEDNSEFSDHGDSGGSLFTHDNYLVGIILGIKTDHSATYAIPFENNILNYYDLKIYG